MRLAARIKCFRYLVYAYIVLISICGAAQLVIGALLLWMHRQYSSLANDQFWEPFGLLIVLGLVLQLICYLGWTGTSKKDRCYLGTFCAFLVITIVIQFLASGWAIAIKYNLLTPAQLAIEASFQQFIAKEDNIKEQVHIWNRLQREYQCCGYNSIHDYMKTAVPWSCYDPVDRNVFNQGCMHRLVKSFEFNILQVAFVWLISAFIQSFGIFCAIQLVMLLKPAKPMLPNGDNRSLRYKSSHETMPLSLRATSSSGHGGGIGHGGGMGHGGGIGHSGGIGHGGGGGGAHAMLSSAPPMSIHSTLGTATISSSSSSTKPPIAQKPIVPKIEHPIIK